ncbi:MAG: ABC transporter ATP-binding protein [Deltaproteobacteria bacterium]|nr:ABC transporter ATP-binding protein [Deltaproteobacteria bacterium]
MSAATPLVECRGLVKSYKLRSLSGATRQRSFTAVSGVSLSIEHGETLALVGESGCGKTTTGRLLLRLENPTSGSTFFDGCNLERLSARQLRRLRRHMQMIFQDPYGSLNPRFTVARTLAEPLRIHEGLSGNKLASRINRLLETVGLSAEHAGRYPQEFSGGQRQRIAIARAVSVNPHFVVADEPVSALDISVQGQILKLLLELKNSIGMAMLFISHDLALVRQISERVAVMYYGRIVELAPTEEIFANAIHPYTRFLLSSVLKPGPESLPAPEAEKQSGISRPVTGGCAFADRCPVMAECCLKNVPELVQVRSGHWVACQAAGK